LGFFSLEDLFVLILYVIQWINCYRTVKSDVASSLGCDVQVPISFQ